MQVLGIQVISAIISSQMKTEWVSTWNISMNLSDTHVNCVTKKTKEKLFKVPQYTGPWMGKIFLQSVRLKSRKFHIEAVHGGEEIWVHISEVEKELWTLKHDLTWSDRLTFDCFRGLLILLAEKWKQEEVHKQAGIRFFSGKFCRRRTKYLCFFSFILQVRRCKRVDLSEQNIKSVNT